MTSKIAPEELINRILKASEELMLEGCTDVVVELEVGGGGVGACACWGSLVVKCESTGKEIEVLTNEGVRVM